MSASPCSLKSKTHLIIADLASAGGLSPAASGFLEFESLRSNSPLPASSVGCLSSCGSMDDLMFPSSDQPEILPVRKDKGKGRAYEPGQPFPSNNKVGASRTTGKADSIDQPKSSSISPIIQRKGKRKASETETDQPLPQSYSASKSSPGPVARHVYRNRKHPFERVSETEAEESSSPRSLKRLRRLPTYIQNADPDVISLSSGDDSPLLPKASNKNAAHLSSDDDLNDFIVPDSSRPSSPPPAVLEMRESIREGIRYIMKDPTAKEKSQAQMDALIAVLTETRDVMIAMKTGGGKSMLWMVPPAMDEEVKCIVVCPFVALLEEQYAKAAATGLRCHNYSQSKDVPDNVQILFVQVEHCSSQAFAR